MGYLATVPAFVLLDPRLSPTEKLLYSVLSLSTNDQGYCVLTDKEVSSLIKLQTTEGVKQLGEEATLKMIEHLLDLGYIQMNEYGHTVVLLQKSEVVINVKQTPVTPPKDDNLLAVARELLDYLSQCCVVRGYKKIPFKHIDANLSSIRARLQDGHTARDIKAVINTKFEDNYFKENPKYLTPQTLFRPNNFERYLMEAEKIKNVADKVVTARGIANVSQPKVQEVNENEEKF